ncbi:MAG TPA: sigma-70 family RNA polymerase sigma factor [Acidimicrobiia bacterium]|nr:sigma-70 family RNA polymerase sigma factor [Acidimicrobiia bacterium]
MAEQEWLAERFEENRAHLRSVAYRMLGSAAEADDAVQEAWLRLSRTDTSEVTNLGGWLTTVVARVSLDMLRSRESRREEPVGQELPDIPGGTDPEREALLADAVGPALLVVLETLGPAERLAFVLHDLFAVPFEEIAPIVGRSPAAARQLASRARRRVQGAPAVEAGHARQRAVVDAFLTAARSGDFEALLEVLDPDVVVRFDPKATMPGSPPEVRGAAAVAATFSGAAQTAEPATIDGVPGLVWAPGGRPRAAFLFTVVDGRITELRTVAGKRIGELDIELAD